MNVMTVNPANGGPDWITGNFTNTDGASQYDGTLEGRVDPGGMSMTYTYVQPKINASGGGRFGIGQEGGNEVIGGDATGSTGPFSWRGPRKREP